MPYRVVDELDKDQEAMKKRLVEMMIEKSGLQPDFKITVASQDIFCTLPTAEQIEEAMIESAYSRGQNLDAFTRDPRFRRYLLAKCIVQVSDTAFDEGDEPLKRKFLGHLPQPIFDRIWEDFMHRRDEFVLILSGLRDVVGKSPASPFGGGDGSSSEPKDGSPSTSNEETEASSQG